VYPLGSDIRAHATEHSPSVVPVARSYLGESGLRLTWILPGRLFLLAIQFLVVPLVLASVIRGILAGGGGSSLGRIGGRAVGFFILTTLCAVAIGVAVALLIEPGSFVDRSAVGQAPTMVHRLPDRGHRGGGRGTAVADGAVVRQMLSSAKRMTSPSGWTAGLGITCPAAGLFSRDSVRGYSETASSLSLWRFPGLVRGTAT